MRAPRVLCQCAKDFLKPFIIFSVLVLVYLLILNNGSESKKEVRIHKVAATRSEESFPEKHLHIDTEIRL